MNLVLRYLRKCLKAPPPAELSDGQLLERFVTQREEAAFEFLFRRYAPLVLGVCGRVLSSPHDIEDTFQATFLVLVRKAATLDRGRSLAPWLHTVAYHLALRVRTNDARRRRAEKQVPTMLAAIDDEALWRDLRPVLDQEVNRLAEKYRTPVILCWLQGKTHEEAARELGWPRGTVAGRLARAKKLLYRRLLRRGITLSIGVLTAGLAVPPAPAVPSALLQTTLRAALLCAAGKTATANVFSTRVISLTEGVLHTMIRTKVRNFLIVVLTFGLASGGGVLAHWLRGGESPTEIASSVRAPAPPEKPALPAPTVHEWWIYGGNASRSAQTAGNQPAGGLTPIWRKDVLYYKEDEAPAVYQKLKQAEKLLKGKRRNQPILPASSSITVTTVTLPGWGGRKDLLLFYKTMWGTTGRRLKDGEPAWDSPSQWSLERMLYNKAEARKSQAMNNWLQFYLAPNQRPQILFENSTVGTLSTDGEYVYIVEDLAVPPHPMMKVNNKYSTEIQDAINHNRLQAFDVKTAGKLTWELGGEKQGPLSSCYFLGPPLPLDGKLYVLIQKDGAQMGELRLVCLDPTKKGSFEWQAALTTVPEQMRQTPFRRMQALHVAAADGLLICPTHTGSLIAVDRNTHKIRWTYTYRKANAAAPATDSDWMVTAPIIHDGKIVFTAPDGQDVYCVNPKTGAQIWKAARAKDLYLGGVSSGSVLLVGSRNCRALRLSDGKLRWRTETGLPSGQGALHADCYYLPLQEATSSGDPEICVLDVVKGKIVKRLRLPDNAVPGNLVFTDGMLVSQGVRSLIAYVPEKDK